MTIYIVLTNDSFINTSKWTLRAKGCTSFLTQESTSLGWFRTSCTAGELVLDGNHHQFPFHIATKASSSIFGLILDIINGVFCLILSFLFHLIYIWNVWNVWNVCFGKFLLFGRLRLKFAFQARNGKAIGRLSRRVRWLLLTSLKRSDGSTCIKHREKIRTKDAISNCNSFHGLIQTCHRPKYINRVALTFCSFRIQILPLYWYSVQVVEFSKFNVD